MTSPRLLQSPGGTIHACAKSSPGRCGVALLAESTLCGMTVPLRYNPIGGGRHLVEGWSETIGAPVTCPECLWVQRQEHDRRYIGTVGWQRKSRRTQG